MKEQIENQEIKELTDELVFTHNYGTCGAVAQYLYAKGWRKQEWISVNERLPRQWEMVLVCCDGIVSVDFIASTGRWYEHIDHTSVTHWMPLPVAPRTKKGGE